MARKTREQSGFIRRWVRRIVLLGVLAALFPVLLVPAYSFINPISTLMIADVFSAGGYKRTWVDFDDIAPVLYQSVLMSEDGQFCSHNGVDWGAVREVVEDFQEGGKPRGASTITMQTAKNLFLWNGRSYVRKALELPIALYIDFILPKRRTMEIYLNIAEWGPDIYGVEAAAQHHFGRSAKKLSRQQAALLAVTLPNPIVRNPTKPSKGMRRLSSIVAKRAQASGAYIKCLKAEN